MKTKKGVCWANANEICYLMIYKLLGLLEGMNKKYFPKMGFTTIEKNVVKVG